MLKKVIVSSNVIYFLIEEDLKMENAPFFYEQFIKEGDFNNKKIFFDFSNVRFVDSSGIGTLIRCSDFLKERASELFIVELNKSLGTVFRLAGLHQIFKIVQKNEVKNYLTHEEWEKLN